MPLPSLTKRSLVAEAWWFLKPNQWKIDKDHPVPEADIEITPEEGFPDKDALLVVDTKVDEVVLAEEEVVVPVDEVLKVVDIKHEQMHPLR